MANKFEETLALMEFDETLTALATLDEEELESLGEFSKGIRTVKEMPRPLSLIAVRILKQRHDYRSVLIDWLQSESERRKIERSLSVSDPF